MVQGKAATVDEYLDQLDPDRRAVIEQVRACICNHLRDGFER